MATEKDLDMANELLNFLQGEVPSSTIIPPKEQVKLTEDQAWSVIWMLQVHFKGSVPESIRRCDVCKNLYDSDKEGTCLDFGSWPYDFCEDCEDGTEYRNKITETAEMLSTVHRRLKAARDKFLAYADQIESGEERLSGVQGAARLRCMVYDALGTDGS